MLLALKDPTTSDDESSILFLCARRFSLGDCRSPKPRFLLINFERKFICVEYSLTIRWFFLFSSLLLFYYYHLRVGCVSTFLELFVFFSFPFCSLSSSSSFFLLIFSRVWFFAVFPERRVKAFVNIINLYAWMFHCFCTPTTARPI